MPVNLFSNKSHDRKQTEWIHAYGEELVALRNVLREAGETDASDYFLAHWMNAALDKRHLRRITLNMTLTILSPAAQDGKWHVLLSERQGFTRDFTRDGITSFFSGAAAPRTEEPGMVSAVALVAKHIQHKRSGCHLGQEYRAYYCETKEQFDLVVSYEECQCNQANVFARDFKGSDWYFFLVLRTDPSQPAKYYVTTLSEQKLAFEQFLEDFKV